MRKSSILSGFFMKKKRKVMHLTHTDVNDDNRILKELQSLSDTGIYEVYAMGVADNEGWGRNKQSVSGTVRIITLFSKRFVWLPKFFRYTLNLVELSFSMLFFGVRHRPEVVHCHDTLVLPIGMLVSLLTGAKLVYDAHELESDKNDQTKLMSWGTLLVEKICWPRIDILISVSPSILRWYKRELGFKKNALILNAPLMESGEELAGVESDARYFHGLYNIPEADLVFVYVGNLCQGRGIKLLLKAFSQGVNSHVVFIGQGVLEEEIFEVSKSNLNVHLHNSVPHEELVTLVKNADVGLCIIENVSLSDYYCLPNKLFEYCFSGLPVLASDFPDIVEFVSSHNLGKCTQVDLKSVTDAIKEIELTPMTFNPKKMSELSWHEQSNRLVQLYAEILEESRL